jgi:hypothetical protein
LGFGIRGAGGALDAAAGSIRAVTVSCFGLSGCLDQMPWLVRCVGADAVNCCGRAGLIVALG